MARKYTARVTFSKDDCMYVMDKLVQDLEADIFEDHDETYKAKQRLLGRINGAYARIRKREGADE